MTAKWHYYLFFILALLTTENVRAQCGGIMEPGFQFLTSSRGCAPYTVNIETHYLSAVAGTVYYVDWGDGSPEENYTQTNATGVIMTHTYPSISNNCGYDVTIDASNACNPRGSVVPIQTQVIVWTNDVISISPGVFRVCQGFAESLQFIDNSTWNCFPRATRENNAPRWIQWIYGTGSAATQIPGMKVNGVTPGSFPYFNPAANTNPIYPVTSPGQQSLLVDVPVTAPADVGKTFMVTLKNWNQCNAYDNDLTDSNPYNPVNGDLVNGDNPPQITTAQIVIVPAPQPNFVTRLGNASGPLQTTFCISDNIYFQNQTPAISGASFGYIWQFFDNNTGAGAPISTSNQTNPVFSYSTGGQKLIRLLVTDNNAAGGCVNTYDGLITISPALVAKIQTSDFSNNPITPYFCQNTAASLTTFQVRFSDASVGTVTSSTEWQWQFYDENNILVLQAPSSGFSPTALGPFDQTFVNRGIYKAVLTIRDNVTGCQTQDQTQVRVYEKPTTAFSVSRVCKGQSTSIQESSTLNSINGESIVLREWDFNYDGTTFNKDPAYDNQTSFSRSMGAVGTYQVALRVTTNQNSCSSILVQPAVVDPLPTANFTPDVASGCSILTVHFTNNSAAGQPDVVDRFVWEEDDRIGSGFQVLATQRPTDPGFSNVFTYSFQNTGTVNKLVDVRLHVYTIHGCETISPATTITINPGTKSGFNSTNYSPFNNNCSPQTVSFSVDAATQSLNPSDYTWTISNASGIISSTSTGTTPAFSYNFSNATQALEDFSVKLTTTLSSGCFGDSVRTIRISPVPSSVFTVDTLQFDCDLIKINLAATQKGLPSYHWVIAENGVVVSDLTNAFDQFQYTFNRAASDINVQFSLDTKNFANCSSIVSNSRWIVPQKDNMNVSFTVSPSTQTFPSATVTLTNATNQGPWTYLWDFGDGSSSTNPSEPNHSYSTFGSYPIKLSVTHYGCTQSQTQTITILPVPPAVDFSYNPATGCEALTVQFTNLSLYADPSSYVWDFGDGTSSRLSDPTHTYIQSGKYSVSLSASNASGQVITNTKPQIITVDVRPIANFKITPNPVYIPGGILYTINLSQDATGYWWDFGDGETSTEVRPEHSYKKEGAFTITLIASNEFNCRDTTKISSAVTVKMGGEILIPNAFSPSTTGEGGGDGKNDVFLPVMTGIVQFEMLVFNRWGQLLFESRDSSQGWNGYYKGKLCEQDVYMYKLTVLLGTGETVVRTGDINLIR
ncbi:MAG: PKD domain-containing protein [Bacteroidetes bacterium]|nr:PKD domain-containing protein [Bacteroidota bacterium]